MLRIFLFDNCTHIILMTEYGQPEEDLRLAQTLYAHYENQFEAVYAQSLQALREQYDDALSQYKEQAKSLRDTLVRGSQVHMEQLTKTLPAEKLISIFGKKIEHSEERYREHLELKTRELEQAYEAEVRQLKAEYMRKRLYVSHADVETGDIEYRDTLHTYKTKLSVEAVIEAEYTFKFVPEHKHAEYCDQDFYVSDFMEAIEDSSKRKLEHNRISILEDELQRRLNTRQDVAKQLNDIQTKLNKKSFHGQNKLLAKELLRHLCEMQAIALDTEQWPNPELAEQQALVAQSLAESLANNDKHLANTITELKTCLASYPECFHLLLGQQDNRKFKELAEQRVLITSELKAAASFLYKRQLWFGFIRPGFESDVKKLRTLVQAVVIKLANPFLALDPREIEKQVAAINSLVTNILERYKPEKPIENSKTKQALVLIKEKLEPIAAMADAVLAFDSTVTETQASVAEKVFYDEAVAIVRPYLRLRSKDEALNKFIALIAEHVDRDSIQEFEYFCMMLCHTSLAPNIPIELSALPQQLQVILEKYQHHFKVAESLSKHSLSSITTGSSDELAEVLSLRKQQQDYVTVSAKTQSELQGTLRLARDCCARFYDIMEEDHTQPQQTQSILALMLEVELYSNIHTAIEEGRGLIVAATARTATDEDWDRLNQFMVRHYASYVSPHELPEFTDEIAHQKDLQTNLDTRRNQLLARRNELTAIKSLKQKIAHAVENLMAELRFMHSSFHLFKSNLGGKKFTSHHVIMHEEMKRAREALLGGADETGQRLLFEYLNVPSSTTKSDALFAFLFEMFGKQLFDNSYTSGEQLQANLRRLEQQLAVANQHLQAITDLHLQWQYENYLLQAKRHLEYPNFTKRAQQRYLGDKPSKRIKPYIYLAVLMRVQTYGLLFVEMGELLIPHETQGRAKSSDELAAYIHKFADNEDTLRQQTSEAINLAKKVLADRYFLHLKEYVQAGGLLNKSGNPVTTWHGAAYALLRNCYLRQTDAFNPCNQQHRDGLRNTKGQLLIYNRNSFDSFIAEFSLEEIDRRITKLIGHTQRLHEQEPTHSARPASTYSAAKPAVRWRERAPSSK